MKHLEDFKKEFHTYEYLSLLEFRTMIAEMIEYYIDEVDEWYYQGDADNLPIPLETLTTIPKGYVKVGFITHDYFVGLAYRFGDGDGDVQIYNHHKTNANIVTRRNYTGTKYYKENFKGL